MITTKRKLTVWSLLIGLIFSSCINAQSKEAERAFADYHKYYAPKTNQPEKEKAIDALREHYAHSNALDSRTNEIKLDWKNCLGLIGVDGAFTDLLEKEAKDPAIAAEAYRRLWKIAIAYKNGELSEKEALSKSFLKSILYYGNKEINRPNNPSRFHASCFSIPTSAVGIYFNFLKQMDAVEKGNNKDTLLKEVCDILKVVALQAWTQPFRNDATDDNVVQIERFRHHVWWVGGNGLGAAGGYRAVMNVAVMYHSVPMVDLLAEVSIKGLSNTSQTTYETAFWTEGFTADGAGWGHGKQCLIWGYPIHGTRGIFQNLALLKGTPFKKTPSKEQIDALMNYFRGGSFYYYKGYSLPCLDRSSMTYHSADKIPYSGLVDDMLTKNWSSDLDKETLKELNDLQSEIQTQNILMPKYPAGMYSGTRWFYNNDDLIKKNGDYHVIVNMASSRCSGLESAANFADNYNFYTADGLTLFQRKGNEYNAIYGAFDVTASPGVTAREGMDKLIPVTNWRGYNSKYNFAAAATSGGENSAAGFIFEKQNASEEANVNDKGDNIGKNEMLYGVKAYKSWFIIGDYLVALGAGVTNNKPEMIGNIRTTIDQTALENEVTVMQNGKEQVLSPSVGSISVNMEPVWIKQKNKFAYILLPEFSKKMYYALETKKTDWAKMNFSNKGKANLPETAKILRLWVDHGQKPVNDTYGYVVYMGKGNPAAELPVIVAKNDTTLQAVQSKDGNVIGAVFYSPNTEMKLGNTSLKASAPCAVLIEKEGNKYTVTVTDAEMNNELKEIIVTFNGKTFSFVMGHGKDCGKPVTQIISLYGY